MGKLLTSVFTDDMDSCIFTGSPCVERHHIFGGTRKNKEACEKLGFIVPLRIDLHPNGANADRRYSKAIDTYWKKQAQKYFEACYGSREDFMKIFYRSYL